MNPSFDPTALPLRDIHLPDPVSWWPLAPGWWLAAGLVAAAAVFLGVRRYATRRHRAAIRAMAGALNALSAGEDPVVCAQRISTTLRRFAMSVSGDPSGVAGLVGEAWLAFLDSRWRESGFSRGAGRRLLSAPYAAAGSLEPEHCRELGRLCMDWVKSQPAGRGVLSRK